MSVKTEIDKGFWHFNMFYLIGPEGWLKPKFIYALDKNTDIMTEDSTKDFIDLSSWSSSPNHRSKLHVYHMMCEHPLSTKITGHMPCPIIATRMKAIVNGSNLGSVLPKGGVSYEMGFSDLYVESRFVRVVPLGRDLSQAF